MKRGKSKNQFLWVFPAWVSLRERIDGSESESQIVLVLIFIVKVLKILQLRLEIFEVPWA